MPTFKHLRDYSEENRKHYITLSSGEFYPDILNDACDFYSPVLVTFGKLLSEAGSSSMLYRAISDNHSSWMRIQLCRVFKKYVSPATPVELLKKKRKSSATCADFESAFRPINIVQEKFASRPLRDEAICALLWEYKSRGQKGYDLTEKFFSIFELRFPNLKIWGPRRAGSDVQPTEFWEDYPNTSRPLDFVITAKEDKTKVYAVGLARYDGDRGGAQEDDRTGGYNSCAAELHRYFEEHNLNTKIIFLNDGPGLLLGTMWEDYCRLEEKYPGDIMVLTLRMIEERLTENWLKGN